MSLTISRIDRIYRTWTVTATDAVGAPADPVGVDIALLPPRATPTTATVWVAADYADGEATVLLAGPEAEPAGALVVPAGGADVWLRITDNPEVDAERIERITVE